MLAHFALPMKDIAIRIQIQIQIQIQILSQVAQTAQTHMYAESLKKRDFRHVWVMEVDGPLPEEKKSGTNVG